MRALKYFRTTQAALREAQRRWGKTAAIRHDPHLPAEGEPSYSYSKAEKKADPKLLHRTTHEPGEGRHELTRRYRCTVGRVVLGMFYESKGEGATWDAAFKDAETREAAESQRIAELRRSARPAGTP